MKIAFFELEGWEEARIAGRLGETIWSFSTSHYRHSTTPSSPTARS